MAESVRPADSLVHLGIWGRPRHRPRACVAGSAPYAQVNSVLAGTEPATGCTKRGLGEEGPCVVHPVAVDDELCEPCT